ncbi:hypothetical protein ACQ33O_05660 [Ferruginibacter sp. SUN002]|uniref:hypothetical protein n=1 Tax=Ferruginibacter sp. SUN002 TaxID=2937789 RepID=UPI003D36CC72
MRLLKLFSAVICLAVLFFSCKKDFDFTARLSYGSLQGAGGECLPKEIRGIYNAGVTLTSNNFIDVSIMLDSVGTYDIATDTINGYSFRGTGTLGVKGINRVRLYGSGRPTAPGVNTFTIEYSGTYCAVQISVAGSVATPATFTLENAAGVCSGAIVKGVYATGAALDATNIATIKVNVTKAGPYSITSNTVNGIAFSKSGTFTATGVQTIDLSGTGIPLADGANNYTITAGSSSCTFSATASTLSSPATFTLGGSGATCSGASVSGTYKVGTAVTTSNTLSVQVSVTAIGTYSISTDVVNGISFSKTGVFTSTGTKTVTLTGTGTPAAAGSNNHTITGGGTCTFSVTATP